VKLIYTRLMISSRFSLISVIFLMIFVFGSYFSN
jgi:hypothetical protein